MNLIYGVLCHKNSIVLKNMINILSKDSKIFLHVDLKTDIKEFSEYSNYKNVKFIKNRECVTWGDIGIIKAILNIFNEVNNLDYYYISIISGDCLPLKSNVAIKEFLKKNIGKEFIGVEKNTTKKEFKDRMKYIYPQWRYKKNFREENLNIIRALQVKFGIFKRNSEFKKLPKLYKGCNWFTITKELVEYIDVYLKENKNYIKAFKNSFCGDEIFFQTIVMNSKFKDNIYRVNDTINNHFRALRYIDWNSGPQYPKILSANDFGKIKDTECIFGRKFDENLDFDKYYKFIEENSI